MIIKITKDNKIETLTELLNKYSHGVAGGGIENELDKACDTIDAIRHYLNGGDIEVDIEMEKVSRIYIK